MSCSRASLVTLAHYYARGTSLVSVLSTDTSGANHGRHLYSEVLEFGPNPVEKVKNHHVTYGPQKVGKRGKPKKW